MRTYIRVSDSLRRELAVKFGVSRTCVWQALNYLTNGQRPEHIREYALRRGGAIAEENFIPNCRTEYKMDEIVQTFAGGVQVRLRRDGSCAKLLRDGELLEACSYDSLSMAAWGNILYRAQLLSEEIVEQRTHRSKAEGKR